MTGMIVLGVLFVLVLVFTILARENWHWSQIVLVNLTFVAGAAAVLGLAKVSELRIQHQSAYQRAAEQLEIAETAYREAVFGPDKSTTYSRDSLRGVNEALHLELMGMGRSWRNGQIETSGQNKIFKFAAPRASADDRIGELKGAILYAFVDEMIEDVPYPVTFVGTVRVVNDTAEMLELQPMLVVSDELFNRSGTWTLFEKMPVDDPNTLRTSEDQAMDITAYRARLESEIFPAALLNLDPASRQYEQFIDSFAFDGRTLGEISAWIEKQPGRQSLRFEPDPRDVYIRYRFEDRARRAYQVDGTGVLSKDGPFTLTGLAIDPALHLGADVQFERGDEVVITKYVADGYQRSDGTQIPPFEQNENVRVVETVYRRPLFEFPDMIEKLRETVADANARTDVFRENNAIIKKGIDDVTQQETLRMDILAKLRDDNTNLENDVRLLSEFAQQKTAELNELRTRIESLTNQIDTKQKQLAGRRGT